MSSTNDERDGALDLPAALNELEAWQQSPPAAKQRRFSRYPARGEARLRPGRCADETSPMPPVHVRDVSRGGVGLLSSVPVESGAFWQLQLTADNVVVQTIPAYCRFCREVTDGAYLLGMEFGANASLLMALGVEPKLLDQADRPEEFGTISGEFVDPQSLMDQDAA